MTYWQTIMGMRAAGPAKPYPGGIVPIGSTCPHVATLAAAPCFRCGERLGDGAYQWTLEVCETDAEPFSDTIRFTHETCPAAAPKRRKRRRFLARLWPRPKLNGATR